MCFPRRRMYRAPEMSAQLSPSEPQDVKYTSSGRQPSAFAIWPRALSTAALASRPSL